MKIYAPVKDFNGVRNTVRFVKGVGETDNPQVIEWFASHGYSIEKCDTIGNFNLVIEAKNDKIADKNDQIEQSLRVEQAATVKPKMVVEDAETVNQPDFDSMTPNELRDWAKANGFGSLIKNTRNKEKLLEIIRGE